MTDTSNVANIHNGHEYVDLGLPSGLLWATCNVGTIYPQYNGLYFAWGETTGYSISDVEWGIITFEKKSFKKKKNIENLTLEQDAAHIHMGGKWRTPTMNEYQELIDNCTSEWVDDFNKNGVIFKSKINGKSVFFPAAGRGMDNGVFFTHSLMEYWTSTVDSENFAWGVRCFNNMCKITSFYRYYGRQVRAVCER